jgi:hypothetical protein
MEMDMVHDIVLPRGRVIDPETGLDAVRDVAVDGGVIAEVAAGPLHGALAIGATGLVVAPGLIDLHSRAQSVAGRWLQACDGVTTALDLEAGRFPVAAAYAGEAAGGSAINYGFSASWAAIRMEVAGGLQRDGSGEHTLSFPRRPLLAGRGRPGAGGPDHRPPRRPSAALDRSGVADLVEAGAADGDGGPGEGSEVVEQAAEAVQDRPVWAGVDGGLGVRP